jgi:hypothetical protein
MSNVISFLEAATPFIQAFDFLLMLGCGFYCVRRNRGRKNLALTLLAICCFVSAVILLGFFLSAAPNGKALFPLTAQARSIAYVTARLLAPFELLLFAIAIVLVARRNRA